VGEIQRIVSYLKGKGLGILITDHNVRETLSICDHTYVMNAGEILVEGDAEDIISNPQARKIYLGEDFAMTGVTASVPPPAQVVQDKPVPMIEVEPSASVEGASVASEAPPSEAPPPPPKPEVPPIAATPKIEVSTRVEAVWPPPPGEPVLQEEASEEELLGGERFFDVVSPSRRRDAKEEDSVWPAVSDEDFGGRG
jgi:hypothetical protein